MYLLTDIYATTLSLAMLCSALLNSVELRTDLLGWAYRFTFCFTQPSLLTAKHLG